MIGTFSCRALGPFRVFPEIAILNFFWGIRSDSVDSLCFTGNKVFRIFIILRGAPLVKQPVG